MVSWLEAKKCLNNCLSPFPVCASCNCTRLVMVSFTDYAWLIGVGFVSHKAMVSFCAEGSFND